MSDALRKLVKVKPLVPEAPPETAMDVVKRHDLWWVAAGGVVGALVLLTITGWGI